MTTIEVLRAARKLITNPNRWTQGFEARNSYGKEVGPLSEDACCWCPEGAVFRAAIARNFVPIRALEQALPDGYCSVTEFNDGHTHAEVLALFDRAIATEEAK